MVDILVIHIGAGIHSPKLNNNYKSLLKKALCKDTFLEASTIIESSSLTNTGYGSSLNLLGKVECDASFIKSHSTKKTKTAVSQGSLVNMPCKYPILEMIRVFEHCNSLYSSQPDLSPPLMLSYPSLQIGIPEICHGSPIDELISSKAKKIYDTYRDKIFQNNNGKLLPQGISDTIGLINVDEEEGNTTIVTSSGGSLFKLPGRIGCAGVIGAGIAFKQVVGGGGRGRGRGRTDTKVSCMCSGNGEQIIRYNLAQRIINNIDTVSEEQYGKYFDTLLNNLSNDDDDDDLYVGFIVLIQRDNMVQLLYGHTTESFHFGFRVLKDKIKVVLSYSEQKGKLTFGEYSL